MHHFSSRDAFVKKGQAFGKSKAGSVGHVAGGVLAGVIHDRFKKGSDDQSNQAKSESLPKNPSLSQNVIVDNSHKLQTSQMASARRVEGTVLHLIRFMMDQDFILEIP